MMSYSKREYVTMALKCMGCAFLQTIPKPYDRIQHNSEYDKSLTVLGLNAPRSQIYKLMFFDEVYNELFVDEKTMLDLIDRKLMQPNMETWVTELQLQIAPLSSLQQFMDKCNVDMNKVYTLDETIEQQRKQVIFPFLVKNNQQEVTVENPSWAWMFLMIMGFTLIIFGVFALKKTLNT